jgi:acyl-coenzyme A thioesterase PaaI-like protein
VHEPGDQREVTAAVLASVCGFLGGPRPDGDDWRFEFGEHLGSNWGAVYGGALAAAALTVGRALAPERSPRSLHIQMIRSVPQGAAIARGRVRHSGRTIATVEVDLYDARQKLAAVALLTMVTPEGVARGLHDTTPAPPFRVVVSPDEPEAPTWLAPITEALDMVTKRDGEVVRLTADNVRVSVDGSDVGISVCTVPWADLELTGPEAACLIADAGVALPVIQSSVPLENVGPNADLTLRFTTAPTTRVITAASTMLSVQHGTATVGIEVQTADDQLAHGLATSLLLPPRA